jgi:hypothetical protein
MSASEHWDDERIHTYVDGELDAFTAARLEAACRLDAVLNARVERQRQLRARLSASFDPVLEEPVPARLRDAAMTAPRATVTPLHQTSPRKRVQPLWLGALAASLVLGLSIGWYAPRQSSLPMAATSAGLVATGDLDAALSQSLSGEAPGAAGVQLVLSFRTTDGTYCRSFSLARGPDGLACRAGDQWRIEMVAAAPPRNGQDYLQAGSSLAPTILAAIGQMQSGDVLDLGQEQQARAADWPAPGKDRD